MKARCWVMKIIVRIINDPSSWIGPIQLGLRVETGDHARYPIGKGQMFRMILVAVWAVIIADKEIPKADVSSWCVETLLTKQNLREVTGFACPRGASGRSKHRTRDIDIIVVILIS